MSETKHTPGPWEAHMLGGGKGSGNDYSVRCDNARGEAEYSIALCHRANPKAGWNAKLIAVAPDLLEALREIAAIADPQTCLDPKSIVGNPIVGWNYALIAKRAIAKAENQ